MEPVKNAIVVVIEEETHLAMARRSGSEACRRLGLSDELIARVELVSVELAGNLLHHAGRGRMFFGPDAGGSGLQIVATDAGPGLGDVERAMSDGYSTRGTPGIGLGAVRRKADAFDVYSRIGEGTVVAASFGERAFGERAAGEPGAAASEVAVLSTCIDGEVVNGDSWAMWKLGDRTVYLMVDGLGHGHHACQAAETVMRVTDAALAGEPEIALTAIMQQLDLPMRATRGAAVMLLAVKANTVVCCGVGNISAVLWSEDGKMRSLVSHNGTVGHRMARVQEFVYPWSPGTLLVVHSDGISTRWKPAQYPGLSGHAPMTIAGVIYRDAVRGRDDATVMVARLRPVREAD